MSQEPTSSTIVSAAVIMQFILLGIVFVGTLFIYLQEKYQLVESEVNSYTSKNAFATIGLFTFFTLGALIFSDAYAHGWKFLSPSAPTPVAFIAWHVSIESNFFADILLTFILVRRTGGSDKSPFTSIYFILPSLAFFLHEPLKLIAWYLMAVATAFSIGFRNPYAQDYKVEDRRPLWIVSMLCFGLSAYVGYLTRPL